MQALKECHYCGELGIYQSQDTYCHYCKAAISAPREASYRGEQVYYVLLIVLLVLMVLALSQQ